MSSHRRSFFFSVEDGKGNSTLFPSHPFRRPSIVPSGSSHSCADFGVHSILGLVAPDCRLRLFFSFWGKRENRSAFLREVCFSVSINTGLRGCPFPAGWRSGTCRPPSWKKSRRRAKPFLDRQEFFSFRVVKMKSFLLWSRDRKFSVPPLSPSGARAGVCFFLLYRPDQSPPNSFSEMWGARGFWSFFPSRPTPGPRTKRGFFLLAQGSPLFSR